jgi:methylglyoxal synthase
MKKLFIIHFLLILFPIAAMSQETKIQLTEKVSISFPEKPDVRNMQEIASVYSVKLADSTANFNVVVQNLLKLKFQKTDNGK